MLRRTLTFGDLLPLAAQLLEGLPGHVMQVVKMVRLLHAAATMRRLVVADGALQVIDKRSNDRCCFNHFAAVVGLCADVRKVYDSACVIFQKVVPHLPQPHLAAVLHVVSPRSTTLHPQPPFRPLLTCLKCDSSGLGFIEKELFFALLRQLQVSLLQN